MDFSIITPSFRQSAWLKLCIASVADQEGVRFEHIVQDGVSDDGTLDWLRQDSRVRVFVEKDRGMYDAVNRGFRRAQGNILAYLNCDEQYLPGALLRVKDFFSQHPEVEVVFGDCVIVDASGAYLCDRRVLAPTWWHTRLSGKVSFLTAATFLRRATLETRQLFFDPSFTSVGDIIWAQRLIESRAEMALLREFTGAFTETGDNLTYQMPAILEQNQRRASIPGWMRPLKPLVLAGYVLRRWRAGNYSPKSYEYEIYTQNSPSQRRKFSVTNSTFRWPRKLEAPQNHLANPPAEGS
jgi:glycosyltransferase involved in cell wall biosynthesis